MVDDTGLAQGLQGEYSTDQLADDGSQGRAGHPHAETAHQQKVQHNVYQTGSNEEIEGAAGIAHGPQHARTQVIDQRGDGADEIDAEILPGQIDDVGGGVHPFQGQGAHGEAHRHEDHAAGDGHSHRGMYRPAHLVGVPGAEKLGDDDGGAGGQAHKKAYQQVDEGGGGAAYRCQGLFAGDVAHDDGIGGVVQLLKKGSQQNGKEKEQKLLPDYALGDSVFMAGRLHGCTSL